MKKIDIFKNKNKIVGAKKQILDNYSELRNNWAILTREQKEKVLDESPILKEIIDFFEIFKEV